MINEADYMFSFVTLIIAPCIYGATIAAFIWWCVILCVWFLVRLSNYLPWCGFKSDVTYDEIGNELHACDMRMLHLPFCAKKFQIRERYSSKGWEDVKIRRFMLSGGVRGVKNLISRTIKHSLYPGASVIIELEDGRVLIRGGAREDSDLIFYRQLFRWYNHNLSPIHQMQPRSKGWYVYTTGIF